MKSKHLICLISLLIVVQCVLAKIELNQQTDGLTIIENELELSPASSSWYSATFIPTMIHYVVVPAFQTHSSKYFTERTRELADGVLKWQNFIQKWSTKLANFFNQIAELKIDNCSQKMLCSLGKVRFRAFRQEKRSANGKIIEIMNNLFSLPIIEQKLDRIYLEARQIGAAGGNCESLITTSCPISSDTFEALFEMFKQFY